MRLKRKCDTTTEINCFDLMAAINRLLSRNNGKMMVSNNVTHKIPVIPPGSERGRCFFARLIIVLLMQPLAALFVAMRLDTEGIFYSMALLAASSILVWLASSMYKGGA